MGNWWSPSWKGKLERGEPLPPKLRLTKEILEEMGVAEDEAAAVLRNLHQHKRKTWGLLLVLLEKGEERLKLEMGDEAVRKSYGGSSRSTVRRVAVYLFPLRKMSPPKCSNRCCKAWTGSLLSKTSTRYSLNP